MVVTFGSLNFTCGSCRLEAVEVTCGWFEVTCGSCRLEAVEVTFGSLEITCGQDNKISGEWLWVPLVGRQVAIVEGDLKNGFVFTHAPPLSDFDS